MKLNTSKTSTYRAKCPSTSERRVSRHPVPDPLGLSVACCQPEHQVPEGQQACNDGDNNERGQEHRHECIGSADVDRVGVDRDASLEGASFIDDLHRPRRGNEDGE